MGPRPSHPPRAFSTSSQSPNCKSVSQRTVGREAGVELTTTASRPAALVPAAAPPAPQCPKRESEPHLAVRRPADEVEHRVDRASRVEAALGFLGRRGPCRVLVQVRHVIVQSYADQHLGDYTSANRA